MDWARAAGFAAVLMFVLGGTFFWAFGEFFRASTECGSYGQFQKTTFQTQNTQQDTNKSDHFYECSLAEYTRQLAAFTKGLAVSTVFLVLVTCGLVWFARSQFIDTRILQRAYLSVEPGGIEPYHSGDGRLSCDVWFINSGNLPASRVSWCIFQKFSTEQNLTDFPVRSDGPDGNNLIPPHGKIRKGAPAIHATELDEFRKRQQGIPNSCWLYVWGHVTYLDGFNEERFVDFCYRYYLARTTWTISAKRGRQHEHGNRTDAG
jgi:hypothetical protein